MRSASIIVSLVLCLSACTLSKVRGETHISAMQEANRHRHHGRYERAQASYGEAAKSAERRVDREEAMYMRARVLKRMSRFDEALSLWDRLGAMKRPSRRTARALLDAARLRDEMGQTEVALVAYKHTALRFPDSGPGKSALKLYLLNAKQIDWDELYVRLKESQLGDDVLYRHAQSLAENQPAEARALYERIVKEHPYPQGGLWDDSHLRLAELDEAEGHHQAAIDRLWEMLDRAEGTMMPGSYRLQTFPQALMTIGRLERAQGQLNRAASAYNTLSSRFPYSTLRDDALVETADMWFENGKQAKACKLYREVLEDFQVGSSVRHAKRKVKQEC